jgi:hypothetical protein
MSVHHSAVARRHQDAARYVYTDACPQPFCRLRTVWKARQQSCGWNKNTDAANRLFRNAEAVKWLRKTVRSRIAVTKQLSADHVCGQSLLQRRLESRILRMASKNLRNQQNEIQFLQWVHFAMPCWVPSLQTVETTCICRVQLWIYWITSHEQPIRDGPSGLGIGEGPQNASPLEDEQNTQRDTQPQTTGNWMRNTERVLGKILRGKPTDGVEGRRKLRDSPTNWKDELKKTTITVQFWTDVVTVKI